MKDRSPEKIAETLANIDKLIESSHAQIATMEELKTSLRMAQVWPAVWEAKRKVRIIDHFEGNTIHPIGNRRPITEELRQRLYKRIARSTMTVGYLTDGERQHAINKLELAYIRGYLDTLERPKFFTPAGSLSP